MKLAGSMPHSQGLCNNLYPETNQFLVLTPDTNIFKIYSNIILSPMSNSFLASPSLICCAILST